MHLVVYLVSIYLQVSAVREVTSVTLVKNGLTRVCSLVTRHHEDGC